MDNIHDPDFNRYVFEKRDTINEHISVYSGIRNQFGMISRYIYLTLDNGDIIGSFGIEGEGVKHQFDSGVTNDMSISIEGEYHGNGFTKIMMKHLIDKIYEDIPEMVDRGDQMLFIDADASDGFWDKIGMKESKRYGYNRNPRYTRREGAGYEKFITINSLYKYALS